MTSRPAKDRIRSAKGAERKAVFDLACRFREAFRHAFTDPQKARVAEVLDQRLAEVFDGRGVE